MTTDIEFITNAGVKYPTRYISICNLGEVLISTTALNNALIDFNGAYHSPEATQIDERIFYFIEPNDIFLDENKLSYIIENELDDGYD